MTIRSLSLALFLATMTFACERKMAPAETPDDATGEAAATMPSDDDDDDDTGESTKSEPPAKKDETPAPAAPAKKADDPKTTTPAPAADKKDAKDAPANPEDIGACMAACKDPECFTNCFGGFDPGANPFGG